MFLPQGLNVRTLRCLLKQALRLYYPVNAAFCPPLPPPSSGVKPAKGKTQLFVCCLYLSSSKHHTNPSISLPISHVTIRPSFNFKLKTCPYMLMTIDCFWSTALFGESKRVVCSTGVPAGHRKGPNAHDAPTPSLKEAITACKSMTWGRRMEELTIAGWNMEDRSLKLWSHSELLKVRKLNTALKPWMLWLSKWRFSLLQCNTLRVCKFRHKHTHELRDAISLRLYQKWAVMYVNDLILAFILYSVRLSVGCHMGEWCFNQLYCDSEAVQSHCAVDVEQQPIRDPQQNHLRRRYRQKCCAGKGNDETDRKLDLCRGAWWQRRASFSNSDCEG